jgi:NADH-quinone oxidoreductase subunit G
VTKITIDGVEVEADPKQPLIRACHDHGVDVPMYCYHPGLRPVGSCRICQVEVRQGEMPPRITVACRTPVAEGMLVDTQAAKARDARRECLEFLLKNHPLDCPICDKAGECDLQDYAFNEGQGKGRSLEPRRQLDKRKSLGEVIVLDEERCILCSRCIRFFEDVTKKPQLTVEGIGAPSVINTFFDRPLEGNYQGNLADVCPVGALTLKEFRFQARVWNLSKTLSTCAECSRGCRITVEVLRLKDVKRFRPRYDPEVNHWWMCDTGRFAFEHVNRPVAREGDVLGGRLRGAAVRGYTGQLELSDVEHALEAASDALRMNEPRALVASPFMTVEEGEAFLELARQLGTVPAFVSPPPSGLEDDLLNTGDPCPNRRGLEQLGFEPLEPAQVLERLRAAKSAVLAGERVAELVGLEGLTALPASLRLILFDTEARDVPALDVCVGVPVHVEKTGHWLNVDGLRGNLAVARPMPPRVEPLPRTLERLRVLLDTRTTSIAQSP